MTFDDTKLDTKSYTNLILIGKNNESVQIYCNLGEVLLICSNDSHHNKGYAQILLSYYMHNRKHNSPDDKTILKFPLLSELQLKYILEYIELRLKNKDKASVTDFVGIKIYDDVILNPWENQYLLSKDKWTLTNILMASSYLGIPHLFHLVAYKIAQSV